MTFNIDAVKIISGQHNLNPSANTADLFCVRVKVFAVL